MKKFLLLFFLLFATGALAQNEAWFFLVAKDTTIDPTFKTVGKNMEYTGNDIELERIFSKYKIQKFRKTLKNAKKENIGKTFFVISDSGFLLEELLQKKGDLFVSGIIIPENQRKIFEPNDYGLTSTIGDNLGLPANLDYLDFLEVPKAWYYTVGNRETIIGISDAAVDTTDIEFAGKIKVFNKSFYSGGHGNGVASLAAAQGNNSYGVPGVCYDCGIYATNYGNFKSFEMLRELSYAGVKVINCSWAGSIYSEQVQEEINEMLKMGTVIVAGAGNRNWTASEYGKKQFYPASYTHVISVSSGMYKYETIEENILMEPNGKEYAENIRGYVGRTMGFTDGDYSKPTIYPVSITTLNTEVDILAPSTGTFLYGKYLEKNKIVYDANEHTSNATPLVSGTIGLMFSLYPCLPADEVESILKMTSTNIDHIEANKPYAGNYGSGMLNTGRAVEMVFDMFAEKDPVKIENQNFNRWHFKLSSLSAVIINNQTFSENATLNLSSKKQIVISKNTVLKPNASGKIHLKINPDLKKECELQLRDPSILMD